MSETVEAYCTSCKGTGLYVGMCERDGTAVVCHKCHGTGMVRITYDPFVERRRRGRIVKVFSYNDGMVLDSTTNGGTEYKAWLGGAKAEPMPDPREHRCPAWWYQNTDYKRKPKWDECDLGAFRECRHFRNKHECWARFDREGL